MPEQSGDAPREGSPAPASVSSVSSVSSVVKLPFPRDLLIHAARMRARGISWETIAARTPHTAADLARLPFDHPEIWEPLYRRAEKLALQEAEGQMFKALNVLLEGENVHAAEKAARELLLHRRHIERRRYQPPRHQGTKNLGGVNAAEAAHETRALSRDPASNLVPWCLGGEKETPEELRVPIIQLACCRAQGEDLLSTAAEIGRHHEEVARWPFLYVKSWDRHWRTARLETARFYAARAIRRLTDLAFDPDRQLAARAARTLLIHRRHMHWANQPPRHQEHQEAKNCAILNADEAAREASALSRDPSPNLVPLCLGGERGWKSRDGP